MLIVIYVDTKSIEIDSRLTINDLKDAAELPRSTILTWQGTELLGDTLIADSGLCAEAQVYTQAASTKLVLKDGCLLKKDIDEDVSYYYTLMENRVDVIEIWSEYNFDDIEQTEDNVLELRQLLDNRGNLYIAFTPFDGGDAQPLDPSEYVDFNKSTEHLYLNWFWHDNRYPIYSLRY